MLSKTLPVLPSVSGRWRLRGQHWGQDSWPSLCALAPPGGWSEAVHPHPNPCAPNTGSAALQLWSQSGSSSGKSPEGRACCCHTFCSHPWGFVAEGWLTRPVGATGSQPCRQVGTQMTSVAYWWCPCCSDDLTVVRIWKRTLVRIFILDTVMTIS